MKHCLFALFLVLAILTSTALGHGEKKHILGTITKINSDSIVVKTREGKSVEVRLASSTVYHFRSNNQDKPAKLSDLAVGDLAAIHATTKNDTFEADEIRFSVPGPANAAAPPKPKS